MIGFKVLLEDKPDKKGLYNSTIYKLDDSIPDKPVWFNCKTVKARTAENLFEATKNVIKHMYEVQLERNQNNYD